MIAGVRPAAKGQQGQGPHKSPVSSDARQPDFFMNFVARGRSLRGFKSLRRTLDEAVLKHRLGRLAAAMF